MEQMIMVAHHVCEERTVARMRIVLPTCRGQEAINDFYRALGERVEQFCKETLFPFAEDAYRNDPDPKKRFRFHALCYTLTSEVLRDDGVYFCVRLCVEYVSPARERTRLLEEQRWETESGYLLRPQKPKK